MKYFVMDCSFSSALFLPDEKSSNVKNIFSAFANEYKIFVPVLWWYETVNVLNISVRRKRIKDSDFSTILELFHKLNLSTDVEFGINHSKKIFNYTQTYKISSYDAVYLELAARKRAQLLTLDSKLNLISSQLGINKRI